MIMFRSVLAATAVLVLAGATESQAQLKQFTLTAKISKPTFLYAGLKNPNVPDAQYANPGRLSGNLSSGLLTISGYFDESSLFVKSSKLSTTRLIPFTFLSASFDESAPFSGRYFGLETGSNAEILEDSVSGSNPTVDFIFGDGKRKADLEFTLDRKVSDLNWLTDSTFGLATLTAGTEGFSADRHFNHCAGLSSCSPDIVARDSQIVFVDAIQGTSKVASYELSDYTPPSNPIPIADAAGPSPLPGALPEPATWAMMLVGFGMVGAGLRYRRKGTAVRFA